MCGSLFCCLNSCESPTACVVLVNSCSCGHDLKVHVFHKAILFPLSKVREGEQTWQLSGMQVLKSVQAGGIGACVRVRGKLVTSIHGVQSALLATLSIGNTWDM
jgi:hypothetical protein